VGLTRISLTRPVAIVMLFAALVTLGLQSYGRMAVDRLPPTNFPSVSVVVSYPGASPVDVETLIAIPLERAVAGLRGVDTVSSTSSLGSARLNVNFTEDTNLDQAAIDVEKRLNAIRNQLPADASAPSVIKAEANAFPIMNVVMSGGGRLTTTQLYDLAMEQVQPILLQVGGVADVGVSGGRQREIQVRIDPVRLKAYDISLQQVVTSLSSENVNAPAGTLRVGNAEPNVRFTALAQGLSDFRNVVIQRSGAGGAGNAVVPPVYVKDVAEVVDTWADLTRLQRFNGEEAIGITITKQPDSNSIKVADGVKVALDRLGRTLPQGVTFRVANDTTKYTRDALSDVQVDLELAVGITGVVLMLFLHSWRNTVIVLLAIPVSLVSTFLVMYFMGFTLNLMSLLALALLIGILVDDSIVVLENIHRHLQLGETPWHAALKGRSEIGLAAIAITLLDVVVFAPIAFISGNVGSLFKQFGITIAVATLFSLLVCFTLTPMLASRWLKGKPDREGEAPDHEGSSVAAGVSGALIAMAAAMYGAMAWVAPSFAGQVVALPAWVGALGNAIIGVQATATQGGFGGGAPGAAASAGGAGMGGLVAIGIGLVVAPLGYLLLKAPVALVMRTFPRGWDAAYDALARGYGRILPTAMRFRFAIVAGGFAILLGTASLVQSGMIGQEYSPLEDENQLSMSLRMAPGVTLEATDRVAQQVEAIVMDRNRFPEIKSVFTSVGGGGGGYGGGGGRSVNIALELVDRRQRARSVWDIQDELRKLDDSLPDVTLSTDLPTALRGGPGGVTVRLLGPDPAVLSQLAEQYEKLLRRTPGIVEVTNSAQAGVPELRATALRTQTQDLAVSGTTISQAMRTAVQGTVATQLRVQDQAQVDVRVLVARDQAGVPLNLEYVPVLTTRGVLVRLGQVATITSATGPAQINRSDRNRSVGVSGSVSGRPLSEVANEIRQAQAQVPLPAGYRATVGGAVQNLDRAVSALSGALGLSIVLMYMLLAALFNSFLSPLIVIASLPLAMIGAFGGLYLLGKTLNIFSLIGIIMLTGLVSKNAILLVDYTNTLRDTEGLPVREALRRAGPIRLRPILMTSATLIASMLPIVFGTGPGAEMRSPVGAVLVGGMVTSTLLTLLFVPALYTYLDDLTNLPGRFSTWRGALARSLRVEKAPVAAERPPPPMPVPVPIVVQARSDADA
jgi:HAE1 family hydrophobic/amphiphilic exporter-1